MKGAPLPPIGRSNTALVLHDMQNDFIKASLSKPAMQAVVKRTRALIDLAHSLPIPVIYTGWKAIRPWAFRLSVRLTCAGRARPFASRARRSGCD